MSRSHDALKRVETSQDLLSEGNGLHSADVRRLVDLSTSVEDLPPDSPELPGISVPIRAAALSDHPETPWSLDSDAMLQFDGEETQAAEEFRHLRARMYQLREKRPLKSLLISSAVAEEGKSFVAANFARILALQPGCRVLLIDADLRGRQVHTWFGTKASPGLSEYLLHEVSEFEALQRGNIENLFFMPCGRPVAGPTELIANGRFRALLSRLSASFDWIVVDSPSAGLVSDACLLSNCCDGVLMVVRSRSTRFDLVRKALERFPEEAMVGVVLNEIREAGNSKLTGKL